MSENSIKLRVEQIELLEKLAVLLEKEGFQPAMAKVVALLLVSDQTELTFDQIQDTLSISKGATSQAINQLLSANKIEYKTKLGERKRYFCSRVMSWQEDVKADLNNISNFNNILKQILQQRPDHTKNFNQSMERLVQFMDYLNEELPVLYRKFEEQHS
ncbi:MarR family transcriptional regulator [Pontibacter sp. E15-1]|uniref:GbsR/MarR family transcriptional regulator n=1 Tax=Pontibacter sp. E15-1 TaxID=2919918 RepID=UPI001F4F8B13|nr:MarR family transcriptional regulator [Pontibacter sp. E15-1]MCJ8163452.1 MarR family transcriptional regulator [Pontibacter sp. E15-1]